MTHEITYSVTTLLLVILSTIVIGFIVENEMSESTQRARLIEESKMYYIPKLDLEENNINPIMVHEIKQQNIGPKATWVEISDDISDQMQKCKEKGGITSFTTDDSNRIQTFSCTFNDK